MSIFSKIGSAVKSAYNSVKSYITGGGNVASASTAPVFGSVAYNAQSIKSGAQPATGVGSASYGASGTWSPAASIGAGKLPSTGINSSGGAGSTNYGPQLPVTINAGQQKVSGGSSSTLSLSGFNPEAFATYSTPTTISAKTLGAQSNLGTTGGTGSFSGAQPLALSSAPSGTRVNGIDNTKIAGGMSGYYKYNPKTGGFDEVPQTDASLQNGQPTDQQIFDKYSKLRKDLGIETKQSVYEDPQVIEARNNRQRIQQALQAPTSELNAVIAKQNQDLLQLRQTGSQEGVTEAVYGGQSNAINYNAAIRALPLQASIAGLQGDLKLAQDYLTELTQIKQEQINNQYQANVQLFNAISSAVDKKDQRVYEEMKATNENARKEALDLEDFKAKIASSALGNSAPSNIMQRIANATDKMSVIQAAGTYAATPDTQITQLANGETVLVDKRSGQIVSNLGGAKTPITYNVTGLTPEQASDPFIQKMASTAGGKPITDAFAQKLNKGLTVLDQIGGLQANIRDVKTGPIVGAFKGANPWDTNAQVIKAQLNAIVPNLARGVFGEVGVLTDNDIAQYSKTLPNLKSTEDIRNAVLGITVDLIGKSIKQTLEVNAANQKDVSGFIDIYTNMQATRDSIFSQIPGYKGNTASTGVDYTATLDNIFK